MTNAKQHVFRKRWKWVAITSAITFMLSLSQTHTVYCEDMHMPLISKQEIESVGRLRVVFGHQSVGRNVLDGVRALAGEHGASLSITETRNDDSGKPGIYHFAVGANGDPIGKIGDFEKTLIAAPFGKVDVALMKLCYVDFSRVSDAVAIARSYVATIEKLQSAHPETRFVAVTSPITTIPGGPKAWVKTLMGRGATDLADNARRKEFNDYLRQQLGAGQLFDIARLEAEAATADDGTPIEALRADLTDDGGHLNAKGRRLVAAALLKLLATP